MNYAAYAPMIADARARPQLWRLLAGLILTAVIAMLASQMLLLGAVAMAGPDFVTTIVTGSTPAGLMMLFVAMGTMALGTLVAARLLHGRSPASVIGPYGLALRQGGRAVVAIILVQALLLAMLNWGITGDITLNMAPGAWLMLLPLGLLGVLIQTGAEEVLFRGYIQSQLAARFRSPLLWIGPQAALFALGHYAAGTFGDNALGIALWAGLFGALAGDLTARSGTLGPAIALHFANNVMAILIISLDGMLSGLSLFTLPFAPGDEDAIAAALPVDFAGLIVTWLAARLALRL
ncbi:CPBP family intramembrane glutamic endopeptidase [Roseivivax sp. CAU 1753]